MIFLVDDAATNLTIGKEALKSKYTVATISSGEGLLNMLNKIIPSLILLDVDMPGLSGFETINLVKDNPETADIPVIFLTGKVDPENELLGLSLGAVDYIAKPFSPPLLLKRIELHLLLESQRKELISFNHNLEIMVEKRTAELSQLRTAIMQWAGELVEFRDDTTGKHIEHVHEYMSILLKGALKKGPYISEISAWDINAVLLSSTLHDVGKIKIPDSILLKKGRLTPAEFDEMKNHCYYGMQLLENLQDRCSAQRFLEHARVMAYSHHEKWNGTGYPDGTVALEIPLEARVMAIVDVYDALVSERPYKPAYPHDQAMETIFEGRGTHFDPDLVDIFMSLSNEIKKVDLG